MADLTVPSSGPLAAAAFAAAINTLIAKLAPMLQGATAPTAASTGLASIAGLPWHDTGTHTLKVRNQADTAWITVGTFDETNGLYAASSPVDVQTFTSTGANTWTKKVGARLVLLELWSPGGSGNRQSISANTCGGGGGAFASVLLLASVLNATETATVGAGGTSVTGSNGNGVAGGSTSFTIAGGAGVTLTGGQGGNSSTVAAGGALTVLAAAAKLLQYEAGAASASAVAGMAATTAIQAAGGGAASGQAGSTPLWGGAGAGGTYPGGTGGTPGGGGGASTTTSGAGGNGKIIATSW